MKPVIEGGDVVEPLRERVLGRINATDILKPGSDDETVLVPAGTLLDEALVDELEAAGVDEIIVRFGRSPARPTTASAGACYGR